MKRQMSGKGKMRRYVHLNVGETLIVDDEGWRIVRSEPKRNGGDW